MLPLKSIVVKLLLTCLLALVLSHVVLAVVFALLFAPRLASLHLTTAALNEMKQLFSVASFLSLARPSGFFFFLPRRITAPLREMQRVGLRIARGDFEQRVTIKTHDEVGALAEAFNAMATELASLDQMRKEFVANVSHDLRSPLTSMHGFVRAFLDETVPPERQRQYLTLMEAQTKRMIKLVNDLLDLARLEAGQLDIRPASFNLSELVRQVVARLEPEGEKKQVTLEVLAEQAADLCVWADPDRIEQVLVNLVQNAIHFSCPESCVEVRVSQAAQAVVSVRDAGPGIKPEDLEAIWQRFYKADPARTTPAGTGIGLSIVKHILDLHHSPIFVHSEVGKGATFTFYLPLASNIPPLMETGNSEDA